MRQGPTPPVIWSTNPMWLSTPWSWPRCGRPWAMMPETREPCEACGLRVPPCLFVVPTHRLLADLTVVAATGGLRGERDRNHRRASGV